MPTSASTTYNHEKLEPAAPLPKAATRAVTFAEGTYARGTVLGQLSANGKFDAYDNDASDGTEVARAINMFSIAVDASGNVTYGDSATGDEFGAEHLSAPVYVAGAFRCEELTGLDANAVADLGRLVEGDTVSGLLHVM